VTKVFKIMTHTLELNSVDSQVDYYGICKNKHADHPFYEGWDEALPNQTKGRELFSKVMCRDFLTNRLHRLFMDPV
jgi:hypothetical protein